MRDVNRDRVTGSPSRNFSSTSFALAALIRTSAATLDAVMSILHVLTSPRSRRCSIIGRYRALICAVSCPTGRSLMRTSTTVFPSPPRAGNSWRVAKPVPRLPSGTSRSRSGKYPSVLVSFTNDPCGTIV